MSQFVYHTIKYQSQIIFKEKSSKFIGIAIPIQCMEEGEEWLKKFRKEYYDANHVCYAFRLKDAEKCSDSGEPNGTAGMPILNAIKSKEVYDLAVFVVRYFGGTKLGVRGLIEAYGKAATDVLDSCKLIEKTITQKVYLEFSYDVQKDLMRALKDILVKEEQVKYEETISGTYHFLPSDISVLEELLRSFYTVIYKNLN